MQLAYVDDTDRRVKEALDIWGSAPEPNDLGYANHSVFLNGGSWGYCIDDLEVQDDRNLIDAIDAIMVGMPERQCEALFYYHAASAIKPRRYDLADYYPDALMAITVGLRKRNLL